MPMSTGNPNKGAQETTRRRSQRVILSLPISVGSEGSSPETSFVEETRTLVVNEHGALIALAHKVEAEQTLRLINLATNLEQLCKVSYVGSPSEGKTQVGLKFLTPFADFWSISFPPDNWGSPQLETSGQRKK
jgi:hypothetical protein